ncbi:MAG: UDP-GlcNAc--UDP-phosphate GlcNAc-1-phosphate transferase, partial [Ginsengibacter sp.]
WRIMIQCAAVILLMWQTGLFDIGIFLLFVTFIFVVGMINAFNFMDGINGITALYSLAIIASLYFINQFIIPFIESEYFVSIIASLLAFSFFNVRKKAKAFAGDVGSVSIAFIISFLLIKLMIQTQSAVWILLLSIYGIDAVCTICFRIIRRENIFNAHRSHFYQFLANEMNFKHVAVSSVYASVQLILNFIIIYSYVNHQIYIPLVCFFALIISYLISRFILEGKTKLLIRY